MEIIITRVSMAAIELGIFHLPILKDVRNLIIGCPISDITAEISIQLRILLKYQANAIRKTDTTPIIMYLDIFFIGISVI